MDWIVEHWTALIGPAVIAAVISSIITVVGFFITTGAAKAMHREKLAFDRDLAERKVDAEIALAEKKLALDRALADWKRRTEFAEQVLADFYKARDIFTLARSPVAFRGEGSTRSRPNEENEVEACRRDAIYAPFERLTKEATFLSEMHARRYRFMALFGDNAVQYFLVFDQTYNQIGAATHALIDDRRHLSDELSNRYEKLIGWKLDNDDPVKTSLDEAVTAMEAICRPVLELRPA